MKTMMNRFQWIGAVIACLGFVSCMGGKSVVPEFYMIESVPVEMAGTAHEEGQPVTRISVEPVEIPHYLDRPQIVTDSGGGAYTFDEFTRWLEPLRATLTRVIAENLTGMLGAKGVDIFSMARAVDTDFNLSVQVIRLDGKRGEHVTLVARWSLFDRNQNTLLMTRRTVIREAVNGDGYQAFVHAQNRVIESLSREISDTIRPVVLAAGRS